MADAGIPAGRLTVLYDADCRVCTRIAGRLAGADRAQRLRLVPLQAAATDSRPSVRRMAGERDLRLGLHVIDEDGSWAAGGEAVLRAMERVPSLAMVAAAGRLPLARRLVEPGYGWFARHRARFAPLAGSFGRASRHGSG